MNIEVLIRWTELKAVKKNDEDEEDGTMHTQVVYDYSPMVIEINDIKRFNRANDPKFTTLRMADGEGYVIKYPYTEFRNLYMEVTGKAIMSILPDDWQDNPNEIKGQGDSDSDVNNIDDFDII